MSVSILVRIIPDLLRKGRVAGQAEVVETGESVVFRDADEVIGFIRSVGARGPIDGPDGSSSVGGDGSAAPAPAP